MTDTDRLAELAAADERHSRMPVCLTCGSRDGGTHDRSHPFAPGGLSPRCRTCTWSSWPCKDRQFIDAIRSLVDDNRKLRAANEQFRVAISGFRWLGNNLHNRETAQFRLYFNAVLDDAQKAMGDDWEPMRLPDRAALHPGDGA